MNLNQLEYLICIADTQSFTKAAELMHITQPAITRAINNLTDEIGVPLFVKEGRNMRLTSYGENFCNYIREANALINEGIESTRKQYDSENNTIQLAIVKNLEMKSLADAIITFNEKFPRIKINLIDMLYKDIIKGVSQKTYSFGICGLREEVLNQNNLSHVTLEPHQCYAYINKNNPYAQKEFLHNYDLAEEHTIYLSQEALNAVKKTLPDLPINDSNTSVCSNLHLCTQFITQNKGILMRMCSVNDTPPNENIVMVPLKGTLLNFGLIWSNEKKLSPQEKLFRDHIKKYALK